MAGTCTSVISEMTRIVDVIRVRDVVFLFLALGLIVAGLYGLFVAA